MENKTKSTVDKNINEILETIKNFEKLKDTLNNCNYAIIAGEYFEEIRILAQRREFSKTKIYIIRNPEHVAYIGIPPYRRLVSIYDIDDISTIPNSDKKRLMHYNDLDEINYKINHYMSFYKNILMIWMDE